MTKRLRLINNNLLNERIKKNVYYGINPFWNAHTQISDLTLQTNWFKQYLIENLILIRNWNDFYHSKFQSSSFEISIFFSTWKFYFVTNITLAVDFQTISFDLSLIFLYFLFNSKLPSSLMPQIFNVKLC